MSSRTRRGRGNYRDVVHDIDSLTTWLNGRREMRVRLYNRKRKKQGFFAGKGWDFRGLARARRRAARR